MVNLIELEGSRWKNCKLNKTAAFTSVAQRLTNPAAVIRYKSVEARTGVPWWFIAVVHEREASQSWKGNLAQGDPWDKKSINVPRNRGPFKSWEDAAYDALVNCAPFAARNKDWSPGGALAMLEQYNGLGYYRKGIPSPYIWAGTNQYTKGKYVADGKFDPNAVDQQLGCAGLLKAMGVFAPIFGTEHGTAGTIAAGGAVAAAQYPHLAIYIIAGTIALAIVAFIVIKYLKGK